MRPIPVDVVLVFSLLSFILGAVVYWFLLGLAEDLGRRRARHGRPSPVLDDRPLAVRGASRWARLVGGFRRRAAVPPVLTTTRGNAPLGDWPELYRRSCLDRDAAQGERDAFVARLQRDGRYIDDLRIEKR
jgi:hypothetical protein